MQRRARRRAFLGNVLKILDNAELFLNPRCPILNPESDAKQAPVAIDETLDARGLSCPMPLLKAKQALNRMAAGEVLEILATDSGSVEDFAVFARRSGNALLHSSDSDGVYRYVLCKA